MKTASTPDCPAARKLASRIKERLLADIAFIDSREKPLGDRMSAARYAYKKAIGIVEHELKYIHTDSAAPTTEGGME